MELIRKEEQIRQFKGINVEDTELKELKTQEDFSKALEKVKAEQNSLLSFYKHFEEFNNEAQQGFIKTIMKSPNNLKMSEKIEIPTNGNVFPWKNKNDLEKVLQEYQKWLNRSNNNNINIEAKYEFTPTGNLKMTVEELGKFVIFLNDNYPLDSASFMIYANDAIEKKIKKNNLKNKIISWAFMAIRIALTLLSTLLFVFTGGLSALGIPPLKALTNVDAVSGAVSLTSKGKALQKTCAVGGYMSVGSFIAPMLINATNEYFLHDKEQTKNKQQLFKNELEKRVEKLQQKTKFIESKIIELASNGQNMPEIKKEIEEIKNNNIKIKEKLGQEEEKSNNLKKELQQKDEQLKKQPQNIQFAQPIMQNPYYFQQPNNQFIQPQNNQLPYQNMYTQYNPQMPINNQQPLNLNQMNQQNMHNQPNSPQNLNNLQQNQTQQVLHKDTTEKQEKEQTNMNEKQTDISDLLKKNLMKNNEKNEKQQNSNDKKQKKEQSNNEKEKNKKPIKQNNANLYDNKKMKQSLNKSIKIDKKKMDKNKTEKIKNSI